MIAHRPKRVEGGWRVGGQQPAPGRSRHRPRMRRVGAPRAAPAPWAARFPRGRARHAAPRHPDVGGRTRHAAPVRSAAGRAPPSAPAPAPAGRSPSPT